MTKLKTTVATDEMDELERTATNVAGRLQGKGVSISSDDTPEDVVSILERVEAFENAVRLAGGDLMVDEPPEGHEPQPDDARFVLPTRHADETASDYIGRITAATRVARGDVPVDGAAN